MLYAPFVGKQAIDFGSFLIRFYFEAARRLIYHQFTSSPQANILWCANIPPLSDAK